METTEITELKIYKRGHFAGILRRRSDGGAEFHYDETYLFDPDKPDLCFNMKKRSLPFVQQGTNLHPYFAGLLPEGLRLKYLLHNVKTSPDDLFSLFAAIGSDCIGDVYTDSLRSLSTTEASSRPSWDQINFYDFFLSSLQNSIHWDPSEFSGVQEKISASMISIPVSDTPSGTSILKLNPKDKPNLVYNEWACLYLAQLCGLEVNEFHLIKDRDGDEGLLVKRFDRTVINGEILRVHQEDMCQVLNVFPAEKYRLPLRELFIGLTKQTTAPLVEIYHLLRWVIFSYLIGNGDLHAKNISLLESPVDGRIELTPAYDLICTLLYGDQKMALKMDAKNANFKRTDFINFATRFGLTQVAVENLIDDLIQKFYHHHHILFSIPMADHRMSFLATEFSMRLEALSKG